ncbi:unnamed protein product [Heterobilharzia americana]|nr:unnamed protein product [Heterobilharzia americana]
MRLLSKLSITTTTILLRIRPYTRFNASYFTENGLLLKLLFTLCQNQFCFLYLTDPTTTEQEMAFDSHFGRGFTFLKTIGDHLIASYNKQYKQ